MKKSNQAVFIEEEEKI